MTGALAVRGDDGGGDEREIQAIREALNQAEFNKTEAVRLLGISRRTLYRKLERHEIEH